MLNLIWVWNGRRAGVGRGEGGCLRGEGRRRRSREAGSRTAGMQISCQHHIPCIRCRRSVRWDWFLLGGVWSGSNVWSPQQIQVSLGTLFLQTMIFSCFRISSKIFYSSFFFFCAKHLLSNPGDKWSMVGLIWQWGKNIIYAAKL